MGQNKDAIRLTNRTALALRRNAKRIEKISLISVLVLTVILCACTVYLGISRLWTVPVMILVTAALDVIIISFSRSYYLMLLSQSICTEAAAREMRERSGEKRRREQAISDLEDISSDISDAGMQRLASAGMRQMHADEDDVEDDDLAAEPVRNASPAPRAPRMIRSDVPSALQPTTVVPPVKAKVMLPYEQEDDGQEEDSPRRRRRKPTLQVIHGDQAN